MLATTLDWDNYKGKYVIGRITRGRVKPGMAVSIIHKDGTSENARVELVSVTQGLHRTEVEVGEAGEIVALTGLKGASIGDTIADAANPEALPPIQVEEPTLKMAVSANTSPFAGREGKYVTGRHIQERIIKELETNVSLRMEPGETGEYILSGRGELHLSVFIETLRREGYEMQVSKPQVIMKEINGKTHEPIEELTVDVATEYSGAVTSEVGKRKGMLISQEENSDGTTRLGFEVPTRGLLGLRNQLLTLSRGTAVMNGLFLRFDPLGAPIPKLRNGALIASEAGKAVTYGLDIAQGRGGTFIPPGTEVYEGMIIGLNSREDDLEINVTKEKKQSNVRSSGADMATILTPPTILSLEQSLDFLEDDELLEVTPKSLRARKKILNGSSRQKAKKSGGN
jgi:GTP-binding protein